MGLNTGFVVSRFLTRSIETDLLNAHSLNTGFVVSRFLTGFDFPQDPWEQSQYWLCCKQVSDKIIIGIIVTIHMSQYWLCCKQVSDTKQAVTLNTAMKVSILALL